MQNKIIKREDFCLIRSDFATFMSIAEVLKITVKSVNINILIYFIIILIECLHLHFALCNSVDKNNIAQEME